MKNLTQVGEFHYTFNQPIAINPSIPDVERCGLRIDLIEEELEEVCEALTNNDRLNLAKEIADIKYVILGTVLEFGLSNIFDVVDYEADYRLGDTDYIAKQIQRLSNNIKADDPLEANISLEKMYEYVLDLEELHGLAMYGDKVFDAVHSSNMSKACKSYDDAMETFNHYEKKERYSLRANRRE